MTFQHNEARLRDHTPCNSAQVSGWAGASSLHAGEGGTSVRYKGMVDCFVRTWQEEGYRAFFKVCASLPDGLLLTASLRVCLPTHQNIR